MNAQTARTLWEHLREMNGISMRLIAALPQDGLDSHPIPNMRTPKELVVHLYAGVLQGLLEGIARGQVADVDEKPLVAGIKTRDQLLKFARDAWNTADKAMAGITDAQLSGFVKTPWTPDPGAPGSRLFGATLDEFLHHRGQLYAYARALGVEPPMMWDFEHNEPAFQSKAHAQA